jgi:hypothetical protein
MAQPQQAPVKARCRNRRTISIINPAYVDNLHVRLREIA